MPSISALLSILKDSTNRLPALRYAWGLLGISVVATLIITFLGANKATIVIIVSTLIGVVLVFLVTSAFNRSDLTKRPAQAIIWAITIFFIIFLLYTVSAFTISKPCNWVRFLEIPHEDGECVSLSPPVKSKVNRPQQDIVIDKNNLTQQKINNCFSYTWESAKKYCENFGTGWRLPTERELKVIFEKKEVNPNCGDLNAYWSSTLESEKSALIVVYKSASLNLHRPISDDDYSHVWCVHN